MQTETKSFTGTEKSLLMIVSVLFILLFGVLSFYNRFSADDYYSFSILKKNTIGEYAKMVYETWNIRLFPQLFASFIIKHSNFPFILFLFGIASLLFLVLSIFFLLRNLLLCYFNYNPGKLILFTYSVLITLCFFLTSFRIDETWFWLSSSVTYLWGNSMLIAGSAMLIGNSKNYKTIPFIILFFLYTGTSSEPLAVATILVLMVLVILYYSKPKSNFFLHLNQYKILIALAACLAGFLFGYLSPGRPIRAGMFEESILWKGIWITLKTMVKIIIDFLPFKILYLLIFSIPFIYLGQKANDTNGKEKVLLVTLKKQFFIFLLVLFVVLFISIFPMGYIMMDVALNRTLTHVTFIILVFSIYWFFRIGYETTFNLKLSKGLFNISLVLTVIALSCFLFKQYNIVSVYSSELDKRIVHLKEFQKKGDIKFIELDPLPSSGLLHSAEISADSTYEQNQHFKNGLFLNFSISLKK